MALHAERDGTGPGLVLVHGFTQNRNCWGPVASDLARDHTVIRVDAPGHGRSGDVIADLDLGGRLVGDQGGRAVYLGYSMGGRYVLHLALARPELVTGLVLVGTTAGIDDAGARAERAAADRATAAQIRDMGTDAFVRRWVTSPMFAGLAPERTFLAERMSNTDEGLARAVVGAGVGRSEPVWDALGRLDMPVLVMAGEHDDRYRTLAVRLVDAIGPNATLALVPRVGHAAHLEDPDAFLTRLRSWLSTHGT